MGIVKKLFFAPFFLFSLVALLIFADQMISEPLSIVFSFGSVNGWTILYLTAAILFTGFFYQLFAMLSQDWKLGLPVMILGSLIPLGLFVDMTLAATLSVGIFVSLFTGFLMQQQKMKSYITFTPTLLLQPQIKLVGLLLIITLSIGFYLMTEKKVTAEGFTLPDPLINAVMTMSGAQDQLNQTEETETASLPQLNPQLIQQLKANPAVLRQYGITPAQLDALAEAQQSADESGGQSSLTTALVKAQIERMIEPYEQWIPTFLALLFFVSLTSLTSFFGLLITPLIWLLFKVLEQTNFVHFEKEMREVKKLVV